MTNDFDTSQIIDEIDRLFVVYDKAKEYMCKILDGVEQQIKLWEYRREIIQDPMRSVSSFDFLLPKTNRINELAIDTIQALCRADLLIEQILRIDPKPSTLTQTTPRSTSFSARKLDTNFFHTTSNPGFSRPHHSVTSPSLSSINQQQQPSYTDILSNGKTVSKSTRPIPVLRTSQSASATRMTVGTTQEKSVFKPIEQQQRSATISDTTPRPTPIHPQTVHYPSTEGLNTIRPMPQAYGMQTPRSELILSPMTTAPTNLNHQQPPRDKVQVQLQRVQAGTKWKQARIDIIDSLSAFYVINIDPKIHDSYIVMFDDLHDCYDSLEKADKLFPLKNIGIGDFGVAKYNEDNRWYRARVLMAEEQDRIGIVFIDFGNMQTINIDEFFPLDMLFTHLPAQAVACTLSEAFPRTPAENSLWPEDTIQIFRGAVTEKVVEVTFANGEEGTEQWPLHFVRITVDNQTITNLLSLKQRIEPRPNHFIAEQLAPTLGTQEYILFNVPISN